MLAVETTTFLGFTEPVSSLTHLLGAVVFLGLAVPLLRQGWGSTGRLAALSVYSFSCLFLLSMSGVYHLLPFGSSERAVLARLDHGAIFVLIAGTYTPAHVILFRGWLRWGPLVAIWTFAAMGIVLKTVFFSDIPEWLGMAYYLGMGWLGAASAVAIGYQYGLSILRPLLWGGLAYTAGALLEYLRWPVLLPGVVGSHELFHLAVLTGIGFHWRFVAQLAADNPASRVASGPDRFPESQRPEVQIARTWKEPRTADS